ncbi:MAG: hypothetical protein COB96_04295 [Planctomycetota bacterium]|nr:MAG: hypothetical protein COB96_04295 [Planctomycetota bacterium]
MDTRSITKTQDRWQPVSRQTPCPICQKPDWCTVSPDGQAVICGRVEVGAIHQRPDGRWLHQLDGEAQQAFYIHPDHRKKTKPKSTIDFAKLAADAAVGADRKLDDLAEHLGVSVASLRELGIGWHTSPSAAWTVPERDATGSVIGIQRRLAGSHKKRAVTGSRRGLVFGDWKVMGHDGPLLLVEGASDTAACITLGLAAIGRLSNVGGVEHLAELLKETDRQIIVVGENDQKADGRNPGRSGAISTAEQLAERLQRPIAWTLPPDGENDTRSWLQSHNVEPSDAEAAGRYYLNCLLDGTTTINPPPAKPVVEIEPYTEPTGQVVKLDDWWKEMAAARIESLGKPGLYCDSSPTGAGKSHADRKAMIAANKSLTVLPTHANCRELADELAKVSISFLIGCHQLANSGY